MATDINQNGSTNLEEISLKELILKMREWWNYLLSKWAIILIAGIIGGAMGLTYAYCKKPLYTATSTFVLEEGGGNSSLSQYSGLASMAGINIGGGGGNNLFQGENIIELYKSRVMIKNALFEKVSIDGKKDFLINMYIKIKKLRDKWEEEKSVLRNLKFDDSSFNDTSRIRNSVVNGIIGDIRSNCLKIDKLEKSQSIFKVSVISPDERFSKYFNDMIVFTVNDFYVKTKTKKATQDLNILQRQLDSVRIKLNGAITAVATSTDVNPNANPAMQILRVPSQKRQIDAQANGALLTQLVQNTELAKVSMRRETPLIQIVDAPIFPLDTIELGKNKGFLGGFFGFAFLTSLFFILKRILRKIMS